MFQEQLAAQTAGHLRESISTYIEAINNKFAATKREVVRAPIKVDTDSLAGGVMAVEVKDLPAYAVDCLDKSFVQVTEDLYIYQYVGHIAGVVVANSKGSADHQVKRHEAAVEQFVREHELLHLYNTADFSLVRFVFVGSAFSGAELESDDKRSPIWIAGFRVDVQWFTSENGPVQHS